MPEFWIAALICVSASFTAFASLALRSADSAAPAGHPAPQNAPGGRSAPRPALPPQMLAL